MKNTKNGFGLIGILLVIVIISVIGGGVFYARNTGTKGGETVLEKQLDAIAVAEEAKKLLEDRNTVAKEEESVQEKSSSKEKEDSSDEIPSPAQTQDTIKASDYSDFELFEEGAGIRFRTEMKPDGSGQEHSSTSMSFTTLSPVNVMRLDVEFLTEAEGLIRIFLDGYIIREFDQRYIPQKLVSEELYIGGQEGRLPAGKHDFVIRLDGFGPTTADVFLSNFEIGLLTVTTTPQ